MGVNVAVNVTPSYETVAGTCTPPASLRSTVTAVTLDASIASLNVADTAVAIATFVAPLAGVLTTTVGSVTSSSVVNDQLASPASALPATSFTPDGPPLTVAV